MVVYFQLWRNSTGFDRMLSRTIDSTLGLRSKVYGYQYSEIIRSLMCVYFCGGSCVEDVSSHLMETLCLQTHLRTCSADTILRAIRELTTPNQSYRSDSGKSYDFNVASDLNNLLVNALLATGQLLPDNEYDFDFDQRLWLEAIAKIVHGGKHCVPASDRFDTKLLQTPHI